MLSNHGGRQIDAAISLTEILPVVCREVESWVAVMIDSGFRRGSHVVKTLAQGSRVVLIGRSVIYGLAVGGPAGAEHALGILHSHLDPILAMLGCRSRGKLSPDCLIQIG
jgi:(S)-mandelate dehydrogenase